MAFSTGFGLTCMCFIMLLFLPGQGQCRSTVGCCTETSKGLIREPVNGCYVQDSGRVACQIHAYIFVTKSNKTWCVDPDAWWLPTRLEKLKKRGITCEPLGN